MYPSFRRTMVSPSPVATWNSATKVWFGNLKYGVTELEVSEALMFRDFHIDASFIRTLHRNAWQTSTAIVDCSCAWTANRLRALDGYQVPGISYKPVHAKAAIEKPPPALFPPWRSPKVVPPPSAQRPEARQQPAVSQVQSVQIPHQGVWQIQNQGVWQSAGNEVANTSPDEVEQPEQRRE